MTTADLRAQAAGPLRIVEALGSIGEIAGLDGYQREMTTLVRALLAEGVDALQISESVASVNDVLTTRLIHLAETELGPPPCAYAWLALGSQGRGEQVLSSDQDSAIAFDDVVVDSQGFDGHDDGHASGHDDGHASGHAGATGVEYFPRLAELVVQALARAGLPLCDGDYMATTWCRPISELSSLFRGWVEMPRPDALVKAEVFMDVRPVHGDLGVDTLDHILVGGGSRGQFMVQMAREAVRFAPPLGILGRLRARDSTVDLKRGGIAAIVLLARLYGLAAGSSARTTLERLEAGAAAGALGRTGAANLAEVYGNLTALRLRHQVDQIGAGVAPDNVIRLDELTEAQRSRLRDGMRVVRDIQGVTALRFATHTVS